MHDERLLLQPGALFLDAWRGCMLTHGETLTGWALKNGLSQDSIRQIATGARNGPKAEEMRAKMIEAAGRDLLIKAIAERWDREVQQ